MHDRERETQGQEREREPIPFPLLGLYAGSFHRLQASDPTLRKEKAARSILRNHFGSGKVGSHVSFSDPTHRRERELTTGRRKRVNGGEALNLLSHHSLRSRLGELPLPLDSLPRPSALIQTPDTQWMEG